MSYRTLQETAVRYFLEVVRTGSVKDAALKLNVAPSAVSRQVARLEGELDTLLFDRRARGWCPMRRASCWPPTPSARNRTSSA